MNKPNYSERRTIIGTSTVEPSSNEIGNEEKKAEETTISSVDVINTDELVKSKLPDANSLFLILIVDVCAALAQDPNEEEMTDEGSPSTVALAVIVV